MDDLFATHDALAVAELVKTRKLGARELLDGTLSGLRALNASLNAVTDFYEGALLEKSVAAAGEGPFRGVPYVIKQLMADCAGTPLLDSIKRLCLQIVTEPKCSLLELFMKLNI